MTMTIDPKKVLESPIVIPWEMMITSHRPDPDLEPWQDSGRLAWILEFTVQHMEVTPPWLIFTVCAEELLVRARRHGVLWDPLRVKWSGGIKRDDTLAKKDRQVYIEAIYLDHPTFTNEKP